MPQIRFFLTLPGAVANFYYEKLQETFEEEACPIALNEAKGEKDECEISIYADINEEEKLKEKIRIALPYFYKNILIEILPDIDWVKHSLETLQPVRVGRFFIHGQHDRDKIGGEDISIEIEAGQAFGTGHHPTTTACLEFLTKIVQQEKPKKIIDVGTGSAILAIAAAKLSPARIIASDNDPVAVQTSLENITLNNVESFIHPIEAEGFSHELIAQEGPYDLIIANILAGPLLALAPAMHQHLRDNGSIILAGILKEQGARILEAYAAQSLILKEKIICENWVSFHLKKAK